jgi:serine/threonine protein kinase
MERIGKYEVIRKLGAGTTATVYLARDPFADRQVAVKLFSPEALADKERGRVFRHLLANAASLAGKLVHPHIVQIFDAALGEDLSYIVMEHVAGGTLERFCARDRLLPLERLVEIAFKCTRALDYAYRLGITHRDIKPANILLAAADTDQSSGDIKISDFGAALQTNHDTTQISGIGSPAYMSPEQVRELPLDHRTDIWSLGVAMYQLLTGRLPFHATSNYGMIHQICNAEAPLPSTFRSDVPATLDAIVARAMGKDLDARYASWEEFSHELARAFRHEQAAARRHEFVDSEKFETLRALSFFREFSDVEIWEVVRFSRWDEVDPETRIMRDGEAGDSFCLLTTGRLRVEKKRRTLDTLAAGDCFGEMAVIGGGGHRRGADVIAETTARIVTIPEAALHGASDVCRMHFYQAFLVTLAARLGQANIRLSAG